MSEGVPKVLETSDVDRLRAQHPGTGTLDRPFVIPAEEGYTAIGNYVFRNWRTVQSVVIPAGVTIIGQAAFFECRALVSVEIPGTVTTIGREAFSGCKALVWVVIPEGVKTIAEEAFMGCTRLRAVSIPFTFRYPNPGVFEGCNSLKLLAVPLDLYRMVDSWFKFMPQDLVIVFKNLDGSTRYTRNRIQDYYPSGFGSFLEFDRDPTLSLKKTAITVVGLPDPAPLLRAISDPSPGGTRWQASTAFVGSLRRRNDLPRLPDEILLHILEQFVYGDDRLLRKLIAIAEEQRRRAAARAIAPAGNLYDWTVGVSAGGSARQCHSF